MNTRMKNKKKIKREKVRREKIRMMKMNIRKRGEGVRQYHERVYIEGGGGKDVYYC